MDLNNGEKIDFINFAKIAKKLTFYLHKFSVMLVSKQLPRKQRSLKKRNTGSPK